MSAAACFWLGCFLGSFGGALVAWLTFTALRDQEPDPFAYGDPWLPWSDQDPGDESCGVDWDDEFSPVLDATETDT